MVRVPVEVGKRYTLYAHDETDDGRGVAHYPGTRFVILVDGASAGETREVEVTSIEGDYARGTVV